MRHAWSALLVALVGCGVPDSEGPLSWADLVQTGVPNVDAESAEPTDASEPEADADAAASDSTPDASAPALDAAVPASDAGTSTKPDASPDGALDAFADAGRYVSMPVGTSAKQRMAKTGISPTKAACLGCHNQGGSAPAWLAGGSVFRDLNAARAASDVEVRIVDLTSQQSYTAHTDSDGNFYLPRPSAASSGPYLIGIRDAAGSRTMPLVQRGLDCNGSACHGGAQGPIHLP